MRLRDALKTSQECENGNIANRNPEETDGGPWSYIRETRRRLIRVEDRQTVMLKVLLAGFLATLSSIVAGITIVLLTP